ncbi:hypothetical protein D9619_004987 [Psilocybe cf. subviscida]|uniref:Uncharacterized protein n=1 Tax=Psilocybe cf. subviscida TaxID=2480587 RepID=A0A8H5F8B9_9AGAR|nr:hypothetical protein D9619_004987 [Psilocybe cf. subviscida]
MMDSQSSSNARPSSSRLPRLLKTFAKVTFIPSPHSRSPPSPFDWLDKRNKICSASPVNVSENAAAPTNEISAQGIENDKPLEVSVDVNREVLEGLHALHTSSPATSPALILQTPTAPHTSGDLAEVDNIHRTENQPETTGVGSENASQGLRENNELKHAEATDQGMGITDSDSEVDDHDVDDHEECQSMPCCTNATLTYRRHLIQNEDRHFGDTNPSCENESTQVDGTLPEASNNDAGLTRDGVETLSCSSVVPSCSIVATNEPMAVDELPELPVREGSVTETAEATDTVMNSYPDANNDENCESKKQDCRIGDTSPSCESKATQVDGPPEETPNNDEGTIRDSTETPFCSSAVPSGPNPIDATDEPVAINELYTHEGSVTSPEPAHTLFQIEDDKSGCESDGHPDMFSEFLLIKSCPYRDQDTEFDTSDSLTAIDLNAGNDNTSSGEIQNHLNLPNPFESMSVSALAAELNSNITLPLEECQPVISMDKQHTETYGDTGNAGDIISPSTLKGDHTADRDTIKSPPSFDLNPFAHFPLVSHTASPTSSSRNSCSFLSGPLPVSTDGTQPLNSDNFDDFLYSPPTRAAGELHSLDTSRFVFVEDSRYYTDSPYSSYPPISQESSNDLPISLPALENTNAVIAISDHIDHLVPSLPTMTTFPALPHPDINDNNATNGGVTAGTVSIQSNVKLDFYDNIDEKREGAFLKLATSELKGGSAAQPTVTQHTLGSKALRMQPSTAGSDVSKVLHHAAASHTGYGKAYGERDVFEDGDGEGALCISKFVRAGAGDTNFYTPNLNIDGDIGRSTTEIRPDVFQPPRREGLECGLPELRHNQNNTLDAQREDLQGDCPQAASDWPQFGRRRSHDHASCEESLSHSDMMLCSRISVDSSSEWSESVLEAISAVSCSSSSFGSIV